MIMILFLYVIIRLELRFFTNEAEIVTLQDELSYLLNKQTDNTILNLEHAQQYNYDFERAIINQDLLELKNKWYESRSVISINSR